MRDMLYGDGPYPLAAWKKQFDSRLNDLDAALGLESQLTPNGDDLVQEYP